MKRKWEASVERKEEYIRLVLFFYPRLSHFHLLYLREREREEETRVNEKKRRPFFECAVDIKNWSSSAFFHRLTE